MAVDGNNVMPVADSNIHLQMIANENTHVATLTGSCEAGKLESEGRQNTLQQTLDNRADDCARLFWPTGGCCLEQRGLPAICITVARVFPRYETCSPYLMHFSGGLCQTTYGNRNSGADVCISGPALSFQRQRAGNAR